MRKLLSLFSIFILLFILGGCASSRGVLSLGSSDSTIKTPDIVKSNGKSVIIKEVIDERVFVDNPRDPSIPSLGFSSKTSIENENIKARAIARKRNSMGKALGDIVLKDDETVSGVIRARVEKIYSQAGYTIIPATELEQADLVINVKIKKFWSWFQPGFWEIKIHNEIEVEVIDIKKERSFIVYTHIEDSRQVANGTNWLKTINSGLNSFESKLSDEIRKAE